MPNRVWVIRQAGEQRHESFQQLAQALAGWEWGEAQWAEWASVCARHGPAPLLIAATAEPSDQAIEFLDWFRGLSTHATRVALLHQGCAEAVVAAAARVADEFVIAPLREAELRQRLAQSEKK